MSPQDARTAVVNAIYLPVFFEKVAQVSGFRPRTPDENAMLLDMAAQEEALMSQEPRKSAGLRPELEIAARGMGLTLDPLAQLKQAQFDLVLADAALVDGVYALGAAA